MPSMFVGPGDRGAAGANSYDWHPPCYDRVTCRRPPEIRVTGEDGVGVTSNIGGECRSPGRRDF